MMGSRLAVLALIAAILPVAAASAGELVAVVHEQRPEDDVPVWKLRTMLTGEARFWKNGDRVRLLLPPGDVGEDGDRVYSFLGLSETELRKAWVEKIFNGQAAEMPTRPPTSAALIQELQADPTCIGILPRRSVASRLPKGLKVLTIGGKRAGDENYAL